MSKMRYRRRPPHRKVNLILYKGNGWRAKFDSPTTTLPSVSLHCLREQLCGEVRLSPRGRSAQQCLGYNSITSGRTIDIPKHSTHKKSLITNQSHTRFSIFKTIFVKNTISKDQSNMKTIFFLE